MSKDVAESVDAGRTLLLESPRVGDTCLVPIDLFPRSKISSAQYWSKGKVLEVIKTKVRKKHLGRRNQRPKVSSERPIIMTRLLGKPHFLFQKQYRVFCYDTGITESFHEWRVFEGNPEVSGNTAFAIKCSLTVLPPGGDPDDWSPDALNKFREFVR